MLNFKFKHLGDTVFEVMVCMAFIKATDFINCGKRFTDINENPSKRIVGGKVCSPGSWPWQVAMSLNAEKVCGGSLVTRRWIATAAHCFDSDIMPTHWTVTLTQHHRTSGKIEEKTFTVRTIVIHPYFRSNAPKFDRPSDYDVALVKFESPIDLNDSCLPICLLPGNATLESGKECYVTGWGRIRADGPKSCSLREAKVRLVSNDTCNKISSYNGTIHSRALCAGTQEGGIGPCKFDSGGPLACSYDGLWYLVGIVSWGEGCGLPEKYGVYSNMFELSSWIKEIIKSDLQGV